MGTVDISGALEDQEFRTWIAEESMKPVPESAEERLTHFQNFHQGIITRLKTHSKRVAHLKAFRVLAALYPRYFSTVTYGKWALECHRALLGPSGKKPGPVQRQVEIMAHMDQLLGPAEANSEALAARMTLPWFVYERYIQASSKEVSSEAASDEGEIKLKPLPALQRRKGFTSIKGGIATLFSALSFVVDGVTREELLDFLRGEFPDYRDSSLRTLVNILKNEFCVIQENDGIFTQTTRGELYLESEDPQELVPLFITRILGVDHVLSALKDGPMTVTELVGLLKTVNPGWTTDFAPRSMLKWLRDFELLQVDQAGSYSLTDSGQSWTTQINWTPEYLSPADLGQENEVPSDDVAPLNIKALNQSALIQAVTNSTAFASRVVEQLHLGLWAHDRRHFAILAGLSGSGKTMLAQRYGKALAEEFGSAADHNVFVQAVQPGWYDPSALFGYINPLNPDSYERSPLLDFLLKAANNPHQPFVVILDEMNLSHPEQYFAPVLSAMESGSRLRFHNEGDTFDGVPQTIAYPSNVAYIGTVNMDETTHGISDKVLDRAFTLEFWDIDLNAYPNWGKNDLDDVSLKHVRGCLTALLNVLAPERLHFGWRTVEDVLSYLSLASQSPDFTLTDALDDVIYARVLPKLRGSESQRLHDALGKATDVLTEFGLERSKAKVKSLRADLIDTGMMRFWR